MSFRTKLFGSASAVLLIGAASGAAFADPGSVQNQDNWNLDMVDLRHQTMRQVVERGRGARDDGSRRVNTINGSYSNGMLGLSHDQQNNGNNNAIGVASNVLVNTGNDDNIDQNLYIRGISRNGTYIDTPLNRASTTALRTNLITDAYKNVQGVFDVQQNNGDGNVMGIGDVVSANLGPVQFGQNGAAHADTAQKVRVSGLVDNNNSTDTDFFANPAATGERLNTINDRAFENFLGLASVQQNNGNGNVIQVGTAVIADIGASFTPTTDPEEASIEIKADGRVRNSTATSSFESAGPPPSDRNNRITNAFRGPVSGIVNAQQNNGDNNSMNVANAVRAAYMIPADIDQVGASSVWTVGESSDNVAMDTDQDRNNLISGRSFEGATGMFTVQQNNGDNNAMNTATGVVASLFTVGVDGDGVMAGAAARATVSGNESTVSTNSDRLNTLNDRVFKNALGIATVQQNNGDNNVVNASKAIVVAVGTDGGFAGFDGDVMTDALLTATVTGNTATIAGTSGAPGYANVLTDSFQDFKGIKTVQQNNGNNNAIQSTVTVVGNITP